jgi:hypothetical protein
MNSLYSSTILGHRNPISFTIQNFHPFLPFLFLTRYPLHRIHLHNPPQYTHTPTHIPIYQYTYLSIYRLTYLPTYLSTELPIYLPTYLRTVATLNRYPILTHFKQSERQKKVRALSNPPLTFKCPYFLRKISVYVPRIKDTYVYIHTQTNQSTYIPSTHTLQYTTQLNRL